jgi:hypothetical protein
MNKQHPNRAKRIPLSILKLQINSFQAVTILALPSGFYRLPPLPSELRCELVKGGISTKGILRGLLPFDLVRFAFPLTGDESVRFLDAEEERDPEAMGVEESSSSAMMADALVLLPLCSRKLVSDQKR